MDVIFDSGKGGKKPPKTRIYAPTHRSDERQTTYLDFEEDVSLTVQPQPDEAELEKKAAPVQSTRMSMQSKVLLLLAIFMVAGTILFGLRGNAEISQRYSEITILEKQILDYEEDISQIQKEQGATSGFSAIRDANEEAGKTLNWEVD